MSGNSPWWIADFDSAAGLLRALARFLHGEDFPALGQPPWSDPLARAVNVLPKPLARQVFALGGASETVSPRRLHQVDVEDLGNWAAAAYPERRYPAVVIGTASGALVHLCAALGIPWLPQTVLLPVRNLRGEPDDPRQAFQFGQEAAEPLLAANPGLALHQMHDPSQDYLMARWLAYFRVKKLELGRTYEAFLRSRLEPGGTIIIANGRLRWPVRRVGERHVFQFGAVGGASSQEFHKGSPRVREFLRRNGSSLEKWSPPEPDEEAPEAEWGFAPELGKDIHRFARSEGYRVARLEFQEPDDLSPLVADLYCWWYARHGWDPSKRLVAESFILTEPALIIRTGSIPLWMTFNTEHDLRRLRRYLDGRAFEEIGVMLFPNGIRSIGQPSLDEWRSQLRRARRRGYFLGVDEERFPVDFAALARYHRAMDALPRVPDPPQGLSIRMFRDFATSRSSLGGVVLSGF